MEQKTCPTCGSEYIYQEGNLWICSICAHEWTADDLAVQAESEAVKDAHGTVLADGDTVALIKDLPVKGYPNPIKRGTVVKNITLANEAGHNISCKIPGFGSMYLKSEFVKKA